MSKRPSLAHPTKRERLRKLLLKKLAVPRVLFRIISKERCLDEQRCGRKRCTSNRDDRSLEKTVKKSRFDNVGEIHKKWTEAGVSVSRVTTHRRLQDIGYNSRVPSTKPLLNARQRHKRLTWAKEKQKWSVAQWSKVLLSDESKFCISFGNKGCRVLPNALRQEDDVTFAPFFVSNNGTAGGNIVSVDRDNVGRVFTEVFVHFRTKECNLKHKEGGTGASWSLLTLLRLRCK